MKTNNTKAKTFTVKEAAALITTALLAALLFTAYPNTAGSPADSYNGCDR